MEIKFCPQCGTARQGAFCGGCGVRFESFSASASSDVDRPNVSHHNESVAEETVPALEVQQPSFPIPFGMKYGESFDQSQDCWNCGTESETTECELCGFSRA
jgi:hypothetical protein